jgi:hypothetical protein
MLLQNNYLAKIRQGRQIYYQQGLRFICKIKIPKLNQIINIQR